MKSPQLWNARGQAIFWNVVFTAIAVMLIAGGYLLGKVL